MNTFLVKKRVIQILTLFSLILVAGSPAVFSADEHEHEHEENAEHDDDHAHHDEEKRDIHIEEALARKIGIKTESAQARTIHQNIIAYGKLNTGPEQLSHIRARYSGLIKSVSANIGARVNAGDPLAEVESNESLRAYSIRSPISGIVVQRHANTGEVTQDQILFSVANFETLWAELRIYSSQRELVSAGQKVHFHVDDLYIHGEISHIVPALENPWQLARIQVNNRELVLSPGLLIEGKISISQSDAAVAVVYDAVQTIDGEQGVFVVEDENYHFRPLILGKADHDYVEVLSGLHTGENYVSENSYVLKADLEKSGAEHHH